MKQSAAEHIESTKVEAMEIDPEVRIKTEKDLDLHAFEHKDESVEEKRPKKHSAADASLLDDSIDPPAKVWRGTRWKSWALGGIQPATKYKKPTDREITEVINYCYLVAYSFTNCKCNYISSFTHYIFIT